LESKEYEVGFGPPQSSKKGPSGPFLKVTMEVTLVLWLVGNAIVG
jgi:hypothetical protein